MKFQLLKIKVLYGTYITCFLHLLSLFSQISNQFIVDASHEEEACSLCQLSVGVNHKGSICSVLKEGAGSFKHRQYNEALSVRAQ